jgi:hypothetical protein
VVHGNVLDPVRDQARVGYRTNRVASRPCCLHVQNLATCWGMMRARETIEIDKESTAHLPKRIGSSVLAVKS